METNIFKNQFLGPLNFFQGHGFFDDHRGREEMFFLDPSKNSSKDMVFYSFLRYLGIFLYFFSEKCF